MKYLLDTNVLLFYVRAGPTRLFLQNTFRPFDDGNEAFISIVSAAEILVLAEKHRWGETKVNALQELLENATVIDIEFQELVEHYVNIELFNLNIHPDKARTGSAIKLGKNDIWIAATAALVGATLLTSDNDFNHLNGEFIDVATYRRQ